MSFPDKEDVESNVFAADTGTIFHQVYENGEVWIGLSEIRDLHGKPEVAVRLTKSQARALIGYLDESREEDQDACGLCGGTLKIVCESCDYEEELCG